MGCDVIRELIDDFFIILLGNFGICRKLYDATLQSDIASIGSMDVVPVSASFGIEGERSTNADILLEF